MHMSIPILIFSPMNDTPEGNFMIEFIQFGNMPLQTNLQIWSLNLNWAKYITNETEQKYIHM